MKVKNNSTYLKYKYFVTISIYQYYLFLSMPTSSVTFFNVITYYVKSGTRIAEQANICVYKAYTFIVFF